MANETCPRIFGTDHSSGNMRFHYELVVQRRLDSIRAGRAMQLLSIATSGTHSDSRGREPVSGIARGLRRHDGHRGFRQYRRNDGNECVCARVSEQSRRRLGRIRFIGLRSIDTVPFKPIDVVHFDVGGSTRFRGARHRDNCSHVERRRQKTTAMIDQYPARARRQLESVHDHSAKRQKQIGGKDIL